MFVALLLLGVTDKTTKEFHVAFIIAVEVSFICEFCCTLHGRQSIGTNQRTWNENLIVKQFRVVQDVEISLCSPVSWCIYKIVDL